MNSKYGNRIRVNAIASEFFIGQPNKSLRLNYDGSLISRSRGETTISQTPMKRFGKVAELNGVANWLASNESSLVTGTIIPVDGGIWRL